MTYAGHDALRAAWTRINGHAVRATAAYESSGRYGSPVRPAFARLRGSGEAWATPAGEPVDYLHRVYDWDELFGLDPEDPRFALPSEVAFSPDNWADPLLLPLRGLREVGLATADLLGDFARGWYDADFEEHGVTCVFEGRGTYEMAWYKEHGTTDSLTRSGAAATLSDLVRLWALLEGHDVADVLVHMAER